MLGFSKADLWHVPHIKPCQGRSNSRLPFSHSPLFPFSPAQCFLCFIVHMTAVDVRSVGNKGFAPLAIGTTVLLGHAVLLPV